MPASQKMARLQAHPLGEHDNEKPKDEAGLEDAHAAFSRKSRTNRHTEQADVGCLQHRLARRTVSDHLPPTRMLHRATVQVRQRP